MDKQWIITSPLLSLLIPAITQFQSLKSLGFRFEIHNSVVSETMCTFLSSLLSLLPVPTTTPTVATTTTTTTIHLVLEYDTLYESNTVSSRNVDDSDVLGVHTEPAGWDNIRTAVARSEYMKLGRGCLSVWFLETGVFEEAGGGY